MKLNVTIVAGALFACSLHGIADQALNRAVTDGAKAKLVLHVVDQEGKAVEGATVKCWLWRNYSDGGPLGLDLITDRNGHCTAEGKCIGVVAWSVRKEGYYKSSGEWKLSQTKANPKVSGGKWQPWGATRDVLLKKMIAPFTASVPPGLEQLQRNIPVFGQWLPMDLNLLDWLPPHGNGRCADALIICNKRVKNFINDFEFTMTVSFTNNPCAGVYRIKKDIESDHQWAYRADSNAVYSTTYQYALARAGAAERRQELGDGECFVFRTRTKTDDDGNFVSAHYGVIAGEFSMGSKSLFLGDICFNQTPNDTNIEDGYYLRRRIEGRKRSSSATVRPKK